MASVLVVDDESPIRRILTRWLADDGYEVQEADGADKALEVMAATPSAVVFCDMQMPGHDGRWLTGQLRERYPDAAVILATADATVPPNTSMQVGVLAYLLKPFDRHAVLDAAKLGIAWHDDVVASGPRPGATPDRVRDWLDSLE